MYPGYINYICLLRKMKAKWLHVISLSCIVKLSDVQDIHKSFKIGERCTYNNPNLPKLKGTCQYASNCPDAVIEEANGIPPSFCYKDIVANIIIVCCRGIISRNATDQNNVLHLQKKEQYDGKRISEQKCDEYYQPFKNKSCAYYPQALIVGGTEARLGEFPFMAAIYWRASNGQEVRCGGYLISNKHILTAAHCAFQHDVSYPYQIRLGVADLSKNESKNYYGIKGIRRQDEYCNNKKYHDIAIIELLQTVEFNNYVRPICLYPKKEFPTNQSLAIGYGRTSSFSERTSDKLMKVFLNIYNQSVCAQSFRKNSALQNGVDDDLMICAGDLNGGRDTCKGDSGGPLLIPDETAGCKFYAIGVTSFGLGDTCGDPNTVAIYTRVSGYIDWIEEIVWSTKPKSANKPNLPLRC